MSPNSSSPVKFKVFSLLFPLISLISLIFPISCFSQTPPPCQISQEITRFFNQGAAGFLLWQYSGDKSSPLDNDPYSFYRNDPICESLQQLKAQFPDKFLGVNIHSLAKYDDSVIQNHLQYLSSQCGTSVIRIWGTPDRASPQKLKTVLNIASQNNIQVILVLADYSNGTSNILPSSIHSNPTSWYQSDYLTYYLPYVTSLVSTLGQDPAIYAYELANEPHCGGQVQCLPAYNNWVNHTASAIRSLNPSVRISIGQMSSQNTTRGDSPGSGSPPDFTVSNQSPNISIASGHYYSETEKNNVLSALSQAQSFNKPFYVGEAGAVCQLPDCFLGRLTSPDVHIQQALFSQPGAAEDPLNKHKDYAPPDQSYDLICEKTTDVSKTYDAQPTPYFTNDTLSKAIEQNKYASGLTKRISDSLRGFLNPFAPKTVIQETFSSYSSNNHASTANRILSEKDQERLKFQFLQEAIDQKVVNEHIAWLCPNGCYGLSCGQPSPDCQPIYLTDLASSVGLSVPIATLPLSSECSSKLFAYLRFTYAGSLNTKIDIYNNNGNEVKTEERMLPNAAALANTTLDQILPESSKSQNIAQVCQTVPRSPDASTTNPVKLNFFQTIAEWIKENTTISRQVTYKEKIDPRLQSGTNSLKKAVYNLLPQKSLDQIPTNSPDSGTTQDIDFDLVSPGGGQVEQIYDKFSKSLLPASWQRGQPSL